MIRWTSISQIGGIVIQSDVFEYEDTKEDGVSDRVTIRIPYDDAIRLITESAQSMGLIDKQKEKLKKLMQFLLEVL